MTTITITSPKSPKNREKLIQFLEELGVSYTENREPEKPKLSQKQQLLKLYREKESLPGWSEQAAKYGKAFRDEFEL